MSWSVKCYEVSKVLKCQRLSNGRRHFMANVIIKCQMFWQLLPSFEFFTIFGQFWHCLATFCILWQLVAIFADIFCHILTIFSNVCHVLEAFDNFGYFWQLLASLSLSWQILVSFRQLLAALTNFLLLLWICCTLCDFAWQCDLWLVLSCIHWWIFMIDSD